MSDSEFIRVLHIDPFPVVRAGLRAAIAAFAHMWAVAGAADARTAVTLARRLRPDIAVTEIEVPDDESCFSAVRAIRAQQPDTKVLFYTHHTNDGYMERAKKAGALGYVTKDESLETVWLAICAVHAGDPFFAGEQQDHPVVELAPHLVEPTRRVLDLLSPRELEVAKLLALGLSVKQIALSLHRSPKTIETHTTHLMTKLSVHDRVALSRLAIREGLVSA